MKLNANKKSKLRVSLGTTVKLLLGDRLVMGLNLKTALLLMLGEGCVQLPSPYLCEAKSL